MERNQEYQAGELKVSEDVISTIVKVVIDDIDGIQEMSPPAPSFKQMFIKKKNNTSIGIKLDGDVVEISVSIVIKLGYKVTSIASEIQERVKSDVQSMTGIAVSRVNVTVAELAVAKS